MRTLSMPQVNELFTHIQTHISPKFPKVSSHLKTLKPSKADVASIMWRHRLNGYLEALCLLGAIEQELHLYAREMLFSQTFDDIRNRRPGCKNKYSLDVETEEEKNYTFDVPAMNPVDAYAQLAKRHTYRNINNITSVQVYAGFQFERNEESKVLKNFDSNELIFSSGI